MLYRVHVSEHHKVIVECATPYQAKEHAWSLMAKDGQFKYGWLNREDFMSNVKVTEE
jgi:hypothetical protein